MQTRLIVISLLDGKGPTGVETHFNQVMRAAKAANVGSVLVSAYPSQRMWARLARCLIRPLRMASTEYAEIFSLWINRKIIASKLATLLAGEGGAMTLYAQDPLSARVALEASRQRRCRIVTVVHYNISQADELHMKGEARLGGPLWRFAAATEANALPHVDHIIFVSRFMQNQVVQRVPATTRVAQSIIPNFVSEIGHRDPQAFANDLIAIGTLEKRKNQAFLLHVLAEARTCGFSYGLTLAGDGPDRHMLVALAEQLGISSQVKFAGYQVNAARLIPQHRLLVHAALMENMPVTLIEALSAGRPILAPCVGGIPEIFTNGVEGFFCPLDNVAAAAELLIKALTDAGRYDRMARAARMRYQEKFHGDRLASLWLATLLDERESATQACQ